MTKSANVFHNIYTSLSAAGKIVSPRGMKIIELENFNYILQPYQRFTSFKERNLNINYIKKEFLWYLRGDKYDISIGEHAKMWKTLVNDDGSINSNYGQYMFGEMLQYDNVANILIADKESRRASIVILDSVHTTAKLDMPCTYALNFRIRENKLNMTVRMRSQDAVLGMASDAPCFSFIHEMLLNTLRKVYPTLEYGEYYHSADSFHCYERHWDMLRNIVFKNNYVEYIECPKISGYQEVEFLRALDFSNVPPNYLFVKWLIS